MFQYWRHGWVPRIDPRTGTFPLQCSSPLFPLQSSSWSSHMNVRIDNHLISFASYKRFVLVERLVGAGGGNMIHICLSCLRRATVTSSPQSFPTTPPFHPLCPGYPKAVHVWSSEGFVLAIEDILGWFRCKIMFGWLGGGGGRPWAIPRVGFTLWTMACVWVGRCFVLYGKVNSCCFIAGNCVWFLHDIYLNFTLGAGIFSLSYVIWSNFSL